MEWTTFFLGAAAGIGLVIGLVTVFSLWWMRPYMKAARERVKSVDANTKDIQERVMKHLWEQEQEKEWAGNNPWKHWTRRKTN